MTATIAKSEITLLVERIQGSDAPASSRAKPMPTPITISRASPKSGAGSHSFHSRKGSAISFAAQSTMARTVQLKMVPK